MKNENAKCNDKKMKMNVLNEMQKMKNKMQKENIKKLLSRGAGHNLAPWVTYPWRRWYDLRLGYPLYTWSRLTTLHHG